jgi:undecaprenyl-diphosphatase
MNPSPDYELFSSINGLAGKSAVLDAIMIGSAKYLPVVFAIALVALWLTWKPQNQRGAFLAGVSALIALGLGQIIGYALPRPRPYLAHPVNLLISRSVDTSFPSDHATLGFAVAVMVWQYNRKVGAVLLILAFVLAFSRVFVGAHYPSDVLGGAVLGTVTSLAIAALSRRDGTRGALDRLLSFLARLHLAARPAEGATHSNF